MFNVIFTAELNSGFAERSLKLDFLPCVGMRLNGLAVGQGETLLTVHDVIYDFATNTFYCHTEGWFRDLPPNWKIRCPNNPCNHE